MSDYISAGYILTPLSGKVAKRRNWQKSLYELDFERRDYPENFGVVLQPTDLVIDCDPRAYEKDDDPLARFLDKIGQKDLLSKTFTVKTGGGGWHIYLKKPKDFLTRSRLSEFPGLQFLSQNHYVVGAGSIHPISKSLYTYHHGMPKNSLEASTFLLLQILKPQNEIEPHKEIPALKPVYDDSPANVERYESYLLQAQPCVEGQQGDATAYAVAQKGRDLGLSWETTLSCLLGPYNAKCAPPWSRDELKTKVRNAYRYSTGSQGQDNPLTDFEAVAGKTDDELLGSLERNASGAYRKTLANCIRFFLTSKAPFFKKLAYDEFTDKIMVISKMPWHQRNPPDEGAEWTDHDEILCKSYLTTAYKFEIPTQIIHEAIVACAWRNKNHPVKNYLESIKWDGVKRIDKWLTKYCQVPDSGYTQAVGAKTLVAAVARIYHPGIKFDYMLILEGRQRAGKSRMVKALGGTWYRSMAINPLEKDTIAYMRGAWIIEEAELTFRNKADADHMKAFVSRETDVARLSYERMEKTFPRKCIFIGTYNPDSGGEGYMRDQTGNRRFWPVIVGDKLDVTGLESVRDQLFAEAVCRYKAGELLYLDDAEELEAEIVQEERRARDDRAGHIKEWLDSDEFGAKRDKTTGQEIFVKCLLGMPIHYNRMAQRDIGHILGRELKWEHKPVRVDGQLKKMWCRPVEVISEEDDFLS
jgi:predicted P-loop ATPase